MMNREPWLQERKTGIGSSDAAAVAGLCPFRTAFEVALDKTGQLPPRQPTPAMEWGTRLEPYVVSAYQEQTGRICLPVEFLLRHTEYPWMIATPDRQCGDRLVEAKTASAFAQDEWGTPGTDQIPEAYILQVQHQMAVTGFLLCDVAVLIGGSDFRIYTVPRSEAIIAKLVEIEGDFWTRLKAGIMPGPHWRHPSTAALVAAMYGVDEIKTVELNEAAVGLANAYKLAGDTVKLIEEDKASAKAQLLHMMGDASLALLPDGRSLTRKQITRKAYEVAECQYVDFRVRQPKKVKATA